MRFLTLPVLACLTACLVRPSCALRVTSLGTNHSNKRTTRCGREPRRALGCQGTRPKLYVYRLPDALKGRNEMCPGPDTAHLEYDPTEKSAEPVRDTWCTTWYNFLYDRALVETLEMADQVSDPEEAELFFVPAYLVSDQISRMYNTTWKYELAWFQRRDAEIVQFLRTVGPYWDRHGGADHLVTSLECTKGDSPLDYLYTQLWNNTIRACLHEWFGFGILNNTKAILNNTKAIKVPYYADPSFNVYKPPTELPPSKRSISIFFTGSMIDNKRSWINQTFAKIPHSKYSPYYRDFSDQTGYINATQHSMANSKFALIPPGDSPESLRFAQAIEFGAIPVVASDWMVFPLESFIPWESFTARVKEDTAKDELPRMLAKFTDHEVSSMYEQLVKYRPRLRYRRGPDFVPDMVLQSACKLLPLVPDC